MTEEEIKDEYNKCIASFEYFKNKYIKRKRTKDDWQEIVYKIRDIFNKSLKESLEIYKEDREKWIKWYNENYI